MASAPVVSLEIGTSKVRALVGEEREDGYMMVIGVGEVPSRGVRKGEITDFDHALTCVDSVLKMAEEQSKVTINTVHLTLSGGHIQGVLNRGSVPVLEEGNEITPDTFERVTELGRAISLPVDRLVLHNIHQQFDVDDQRGVINPEGMVGAKLSVSMLILHGVRNRINTLVKVANSARVEVDGCAFGGLCSALAVLTPEQKESGCVVIDLGAGTTDFVVYANRCIATAGSLGVGGDHITNDLAMVLNIPMQQAEKLKVDLGIIPSGREVAEQPVIIPPSGGFQGRTVRLHDVNAIVSARLDETIGMIRSELVRHNLLRGLGAGVVLTGGGSYMKNMVPYVSESLQMPCTIGRPRNVSGIAVATEGPEYAAAVGMLRYGIRSTENVEASSLRGLLSRLFRR